MTFNQRVRDSSSRRSTNKKDHPCDGLFYWCPLLKLNHVAVGEGCATLRPVSLCETTHLSVRLRLYQAQNSRRTFHHPCDGLFYCSL